MSIPHVVARPLIGYWLKFSPNSWKHRVTAQDAPHVHAPGVNPDRVLVFGDGVASGRGVTTHDLGLPGFLARALSARTGHATDVDIIVDEEMTVGSCRDAIDGLEPGRYDSILVSLGHNEALGLLSPARWRDRLNDLLDDLDRKTPPATSLTFLTIPVFGPRTALPPRLAAVVDKHVGVLNAITADLVQAHPTAALITTDDNNEFEPETIGVYRRWANHVAAALGPALAAEREPATDAIMDEMGRQLALEELELSGTGSDELLNDLVQIALDALGTPIAAVTMIHSDYQTTRALAGLTPEVVPRATSFCDVTIRRSTHLVIEDTTADPDYAHHPIVTAGPAVRSYAGYPIESPDGYRVGAFCVMDTKPRTYSSSELSTLRSLAQRAQSELWPPLTHEPR